MILAIDKLHNIWLDTSIPYPYNLAEVLTQSFSYVDEDDKVVLREITPETARSIAEEPPLSRNREILLAFLRENISMQELGARYNITRERVRQIVFRELLKIRNPYTLNKHLYVPIACTDELRAEIDRLTSEIERLQKELDWFHDNARVIVTTDKDASIDTILDQITEVAGKDTTFLDENPVELWERGILSVRSANCLARARLTLRDVLDMDLESIRSIRNLGKNSVDEIVRVFHEHGYKMAWEREDKK